MNYNDYVELLKRHNGYEYLFVTKLQIVDFLENMEGKANNLTEKQRNNLMNNIASYWIDSDLQESSLWDITWLAVAHELQDLTSADFYEKMDTLV